jgi:hypothetical protein
VGANRALPQGRASRNQGPPRDTANLAAEAKARGYGTQALERYFQLTGFRETNVDALRHHRLALFGPPCRTCGKPLRTPRAELCAECGATVSE